MPAQNTLPTLLRQRGSFPIRRCNPGTSLRRGRLTDLETCMAIWRAASEIGHPFLDAADLDADADLIRAIHMPAADITVAEQGGTVAGFIALSGSLIGALFVAPTHHRRGIGRRLLSDAMRRRRRLEVEVYLANHAARSFYAKAGFVEDLCRFSDDQGRPHRLVRMRLSASERTGQIQPWAAA